VKPADLMPLLKYDGVLAVLMIKDGSVLEKAGSPGADTDGLAASLTLLMNESGVIADGLRNRSIPMIFLEFEMRLLLIQALDDDRFMTIITRADANIGQISYRLKKMKTGSGT
jgi:predicted regulator of Ras-like GTPase activity (Roadblock/LC7/MglB family)